MEIIHLGHSSFKIRAKGVVLVTDPYSSLDTGLKFPKVEADIITVSHDHQDHNAVSQVGGMPVIIRGPGEYEIKGIRIFGLSSFHDQEKGAKRGRNTIYQIKMDNLSLLHLGDLGEKPTQEQIELLGSVDVLMIPVGGIFTISASEAAKIAADLEPRIVIPMHYKVPGLKFELEEVEKFLKEMGKEVKPIDKLIVGKDKLPEGMQVVLLENQKSKI